MLPWNMSLLVLKFGPPMRKGLSFRMLMPAGIATVPRDTPSTTIVSAADERTQRILCHLPSATSTEERTRYDRVEPRPTTTHCARPWVSPTCIFHWLSVVATPFWRMFDE